MKQIDPILLIATIGAVALVGYVVYKKFNPTANDNVNTALIAGAGAANAISGIITSISNGYGTNGDHYTGNGYTN